MKTPMKSVRMKFILKMAEFLTVIPVRLNQRQENTTEEFGILEMSQDVNNGKKHYNSLLKERVPKSVANFFAPAFVV